MRKQCLPSLGVLLRKQVPQLPDCCFDLEAITCLHVLDSEMLILHAYKI